MDNTFIYKRATIADIGDLVSSRIQTLKTVFNLNEDANIFFSLLVLFSQMIYDDFIQ